MNLLINNKSTMDNISLIFIFFYNQLMLIMKLTAWIYIYIPGTSISICNKVVVAHHVNHTLIKSLLPIYLFFLFFLENKKTHLIQ